MWDLWGVIVDFCSDRAGATAWICFWADIIIGFSYLSIPLCLVLMLKRADLPYPWLFLLFGLFIMACGMTHFTHAFTWLYYPLDQTPDPWWAALSRIITAAVSAPTAAVTWIVLPKALALPSLWSELQAALAREKHLHAELDARVSDILEVGRAAIAAAEFENDPNRYRVGIETMEAIARNQNAGL